MTQSWKIAQDGRNKRLKGFKMFDIPNSLGEVLEDFDWTVSYVWHVLFGSNIGCTPNSQFVQQLP